MITEDLMSGKSIERLIQLKTMPHVDINITGLLLSSWINQNLFPTF